MAMMSKLKHLSDKPSYVDDWVTAQSELVKQVRRSFGVSCLMKKSAAA